MAEQIAKLSRPFFQLSHPFIYGDRPPGYPIIRIRFGTDHDIRADDNSNDQQIGNCHDILTPYLWVAIVLPLTLLAAWGIIEVLLAYGGWIARDEIRERTRKQIADFPRQIYELRPAINLMDKKRFMSASCYYTVRLETIILLLLTSIDNSVTSIFKITPR